MKLDIEAISLRQRMEAAMKEFSECSKALVKAGYKIEPNQSDLTVTISRPTVETYGPDDEREIL